MMVVNPKYDRIADIQCVARVDDLPQPPDATWLGVPISRTVEIVGKLSNLGAGAVVCYTAGFSEVGETNLKCPDNCSHPA